jgi:hypothetical protein
MYCSNRGVALATDAKFCPQCGRPVTAPADVAKPPLDLPPVVEIAPAVELAPSAEPQAGSGPPAFPAETPKVSPVFQTPQALQETKIEPPEQERASSIKGAMKDSSAAETAAVGCVIAGLGVLIFVPTPIEFRVGAFVIYLVIAFGIWKMSRVAAIIGLLLACSNLVMALVVIFSAFNHVPVVRLGEAPPSPAVDAGKVAPALLFTGLWIKWLYQAVRGTFSYHRARAAKP